MARNKFFPAAGCPAGREGDRGFETPLREAARTARTRRTRHGVTFLVPTSDLTDEIRSPIELFFSAERASGTRGRFEDVPVLRVREHGLQDIGVVGAAAHVDGDRRLELEVLAPAGGAGLADVEGLGVVRLEPRVVALGALALPPWTF